MCFVSSHSKAANTCVDLFVARSTKNSLARLEDLKISKIEAEDMSMNEEFNHYSGGFGALGMWRDGIVNRSRSKSSLFRGMVLTAEQLKSVLSEGMLISKTRGFNSLHFGTAQTALNYGLARLPYQGRNLMVIFEVETSGLDFKPYSKIITKLESDLPAEAIISIFILDRKSEREFPFRHIRNGSSE